MPGELSDDFKDAVLGREITGIVFIHGYVSIILDGYEFDSDGFTVYSDLTVATEGGKFKTGEEDFRGGLYQLLGKRVLQIEDTERDFIVTCENNVSFEFELGMPNDAYSEVALFKSGDLFVIFENEMFEGL